MAIVAAADVAPADEGDTAPELEPDPGLLPRGRRCSRPAPDVKAYREGAEPICHTDDTTHGAFRARSDSGDGISVGRPEDPQLGDRATSAAFVLDSIGEVRRCLDRPAR